MFRLELSTYRRVCIHIHTHIYIAREGERKIKKTHEYTEGLFSIYLLILCFLVSWLPRKTNQEYHLGLAFIALTDPPTGKRGHPGSDQGKARVPRTVKTSAKSCGNFWITCVFSVTQTFKGLVN